MASYASLVSLQHVLEQILDLDGRHSSVHGAKQQMKNLHRNIIFLVAFLEEFPEDADELLDQRVREAANQAEDIIERQISDEMHWKYKCLDVLHCIRQVVPLEFPVHQIVGGMELQLQDWQKLFEELRGVLKEVESIVEEVTRIKSSSGKKDPILSDLPTSTCGSSSSGLAPGDEDTKAVGLEQESLEIKERLCGASSKLETILIIGMGGIGKTTLARYVYDDSLIAHRFNTRAWVTVSQNYHIKNILSSILYSLNSSTKEQSNEMSEKDLLLRLRQFLRGRTYLIVMDDVWDANVWEVLRQVFPNDSNGSRIIITSREGVVAPDVNPSNLYQLKLLDRNQSWKLFKEKVFGQEDCPPELEEIGMFIAKKCGGLPITIVVVAGILSKDRMQKTWERIAHNVNEVVNSSDGKLTDILQLSYKHLPQHLRPCFLYMGGFPEDYEIGVSRLMKLWVAEGFLNLKRSKNLEKVANEYLEDLVKRSLVLVMKRKYNGNIKTVKIHDLLRNLSLKIAQKEKFFQEMQMDSPTFQEDIQNVRRVSTISDGLADFQGSNDSSVRTILFSGEDMVYMPWKSFKLIRILDAYDVPFKYIPIEIGQLFHLRYFHVAINMILSEYEVPEFLSQLRNLQTLIITPFPEYQWAFHVFSAPCGIWRLTQLKHLKLLNVYLPDFSAEEFITLENIHTISTVACFICSDKILKLVPNLNKLKIYYPYIEGGPFQYTKWSTYNLKDLVHFQFLEELDINVRILSRHDKLSKCIAFPQALKKLTLYGCRLSWDDMTIIGSLPNLEVLRLRKNAFRGNYWKTLEGEFCRLKELSIKKSDPKHWETESLHFPCLQSLLLLRCSRLKEIPTVIGDIPTLQLIELNDCNPHVEESAKCIEEEQQSLGNDELQVRILRPNWDF